MYKQNLTCFQYVSSNLSFRVVRGPERVSKTCYTAARKLVNFSVVSLKEENDRNTGEAKQNIENNCVLLI